MAYWASFYEKLFNFREIRYFDIKGEYTGPHEQGDDGARRQDPHPAERGGGPRRHGADREFLMQFNGEGIQHIALLLGQPARHDRQPEHGRACR
jgi:4-hydroxyphenylpyruvate dioxygenase